MRRHQSAGDLLNGHSAFTRAGYLVYCSGERGGDIGWKNGHGEVGLAMRTSITCAARPPEFISDSLQEITLELRSRAGAVTLMWRMPQLKRRMLVINMHSGRPCTDVGGA